MIDYNELNVNRMVMHVINRKEGRNDHATVDPADELLELDSEVIGTIKSRLIEATGKDSKAFELEIEDDSDKSFFNLANNLYDLDDEYFLNNTISLADGLASSQKRTNIPGGYFIVIDAYENNLPSKVAIVIKAEPHEALQVKEEEGNTQIQLLRKVFLSPTQKLYKIGILFEKPSQEGDINSRYGCLLFDDQFRIDAQPAEYFYKDFLGFTTSSNSKIQTRRFYEKTSEFIKSEVTDYDQKNELLNTLRVQFTINQSPLVRPSEFAQSHFEGELADKYYSEVVNELPSSFQKDGTLIQHQLKNENIHFPDKININGPVPEFNQRVKVINDQSELEELDAENESYTIVKIQGKPFSDE